MLIRLAGLLLISLSLFAADWNPSLAAHYLDNRQKDWFAWPPAASNGGPCLSCHTTVFYLMARPALRRVLGEATPTTYETGLVSGVQARTSDRTPKGDGSSFGTQSVLAPLVLAFEDRRNGRGLSRATEEAFRRMWDFQIKTGENSGAWLWTDAHLDPFETQQSMFYGAALAALATGIAPQEYQSRQDIRPNMESLEAYFKANLKGQPLHNRLTLLWASTQCRGLLTPNAKQAIVAEVLAKQAADGGWTMESLGPWMAHPKAASTPGSSTYATAYVTLILQKAGTSRGEQPIARAVDWLKSHQDPQTGSWPAASMNKRYETGSMPEKFLQDVATGFATLALLESGHE